MMREQTPPPRRPQKSECETASPKESGVDEWTRSPLPGQPRHRMQPAKISAEVCFSSPKPCDKENITPAWDNCVVALDPLSESPPFKPHMALSPDETEMDQELFSHLTPAWVPESPSFETYQDDEKDEDEMLSKASMGDDRPQLPRPKTRHTFLQYDSPLKTIKVQTPPNSVPPHFAPAGMRRFASPVRRLLSPARSPGPLGGRPGGAHGDILRLADFLPEPPDCQSCGIAQGGAPGGCCYQGVHSTSGDMSAFPDWLGFSSWEPPLFGSDMPSMGPAMQPQLSGMEAIPSQGCCTDASQQWPGCSIGAAQQQVFSQPYQQMQHQQMPFQQGTMQQTQPPPSLPQQSQLPAQQSAQQQLQQVQAQLQQLQLQLQQAQAQLSQPAPAPAAQPTPPNPLQQLQATPLASQWGESTETQQPTETSFTPAPQQPPAQQPQQQQQPQPATALPLQQQLQQVVAGRVSISVGHFPEPSEAAAGAASQATSGAETTSTSMPSSTAQLAGRLLSDGVQEGARSDSGRGVHEAAKPEPVSRGHKMGRMGRRR